MSTHHHNVAAAIPRGVQLVVRLYPWSVLWILFAVAMILIVRGSWTVLSLVCGLVVVVTWHSIHADHAEHPRPPRRKR